MAIPVLKIFSISRYCEKARWALDYCKVDYGRRNNNLTSSALMSAQSSFIMRFFCRK